MPDLQALKDRQQEHLIQALLSLHQYAIYAIIDSSMAVPGEIDKIIKDLGYILQEEYKND